MASYTMQLREYIEQVTQNQPELNVRQQIEAGRTKLFDFDYPIFDESYRKVFETHLIRNFYMREIGFETEGLFKFQLETWLLIHMPFFNKMYESELIDFNPLENSSLDETRNVVKDKIQSDKRDIVTGVVTKDDSHTKSDKISDVTTSSESDTTTTSTDDNFDRHLKSNTPDSRLTITTNDGEGVIEYASEINENNENNVTNGTGNEISSGTSHTDDGVITDVSMNGTNDSTKNDNLNSNINDVEDFIMHRAGKVGIQSYSYMLQEYRQSFLRIEKQIFNEMQELFMLVY